ncbi:MAG: hypothetical protein ACYC3X_26615 [Pirellulaceae bacterium]
MKDTPRTPIPTSSLPSGDQPLTGLPLFDSARAAAERDAAIAAVEHGAPPEVLADIYAAIRKVAREYPTFTTDHVWREVPPEHHQGIDPRAIGAAMVAAAREGIITRLPGVFVASEMVRCHRRPKQVWRSRRTLR